MSTVAKGNRRQPGSVKNSVPKNASSDAAPKDGRGRKGSPGNPVAPRGVEVSRNMAGHGNIKLSGTP